MEKTINILMEEFKSDMVNTINNSNLPLSITTLILKDLLIEMQNLSQQQYIKDRESYEESLKTDTKESIEEA